MIPRPSAPVFESAHTDGLADLITCLPHPHLTPSAPPQRIEGLRLAIAPAGAASASPVVLRPTEAAGAGGGYVYEARHWGAPGEELTVTATAAGDEDVMFDPAAAVFKVAAGACEAGRPAAELRARKGLRLAGRVRPAVAGVEVCRGPPLPGNGCCNCGVAAARTSAPPPSLVPLPGARAVNAALCAGVRARCICGHAGTRPLARRPLG